jgi:hypothetical protein
LTVVIDKIEIPGMVALVQTWCDPTSLFRAEHDRDVAIRLGVTVFKTAPLSGPLQDPIRRIAGTESPETFLSSGYTSDEAARKLAAEHGPNTLPKGKVAKTVAERLGLKTPFPPGAAGRW